MIPAIVGIILLIIVIYVALRILKNIVLGALLIALIFLASFLIFGSMPDLSSIPVVGPYIVKYLPKLPATTGEAIAIIRNVFYSMDILAVTRDADGSLLVVVANTGRLDVYNFKVFIDGQSASIVNEPRDPLKSGETTVLQADWKEGFTRIDVKTDQATASYITQLTS